MPIYEYKCKSCGDVVEVIQRVGERPLRKCRHCAGRMEKLISRTGFILKGGGWFAEGYHKGDGAKAKAKGGPKTNLADKGSSSKTESKSKPTTSKSSD